MMRRWMDGEREVGTRSLSQNNSQERSGLPGQVLDPQLAVARGVRGGGVGEAVNGRGRRVRARRGGWVCDAQVNGPALSSSSSLSLSHTSPLSRRAPPRPPPAHHSAVRGGQGRGGRAGLGRPRRGERASAGAGVGPRGRRRRGCPRRASWWAKKWLRRRCLCVFVQAAGGPLGRGAREKREMMASQPALSPSSFFFSFIIFFFLYKPRRGDRANSVRAHAHAQRSHGRQQVAARHF